MMPPDSTKIPHEVEPETPLTHWITVASFDTEEKCEKALADIQNSEQDPITLDKTGRLKRYNRNDAALDKARALNAGCVASDDIRLKAARTTKSN